MANSFIEVSTSGTSYVLPTTFEYLNINDINALGKNGDGSYSSLTISSRTASTRTIVLSGTPSQSTVRFYRATTADPLVDFTNGARLTEADLDKAYRQGLFAAQEVVENAAGSQSGVNVTNIAYSQLAGGFTLPTSQLTGTITNAQLAGSIANSKLVNIENSKLAAGVGTSANNLVALDSNAKLPAVDGSQLTNVPQGLIFLLSQDFTSATALFDISDTYITTTYDDYLIMLDLRPQTDNVSLHIQPLVGGAADSTSGNFESRNSVIGFNLHGHRQGDTSALAVLNETTVGIGNADGEGITSEFYLRNVNKNTRPVCVTGQSTYILASSGQNYGTSFTGTYLPAHRAKDVDGLRIKFSSGNILEGNIKIFGVSKT